MTKKIEVPVVSLSDVTSAAAAVRVAMANLNEAIAIAEKLNVVVQISREQVYPQSGFRPLRFKLTRLDFKL